MQLEKALRGELIRLQDSAGLSAPRDVRGIAALFGDLGTRKGRSTATDALAREAGVSRRQAQRYLTTAKQQRQPSGKALDKLLRAGERVTRSRFGRQLARRGLRVNFAGKMIVSPGSKRWGNDEREKSTSAPVEIPGDELAGLIAAFEGHHWDEVADEFNEVFPDAWGIGPAVIITDVDELDLELGR